MSLAPRFMVTDLRTILHQAWLARAFAIFVPAPLFHRLNEFFTRYGSRRLNRAFLAEQYDRAHERAIRSLEALQEVDFHKSLRYPDYDPLLSGEVTIERLFHYIKLHFEVHAGQIRESLDGILV
jgi:hypothetical protein